MFILYTQVLFDETLPKSRPEDEINLLVIVVDVNPIWWGQQAQRDPQVLAVMSVVTLSDSSLSECL